MPSWRSCILRPCGRRGPHSTGRRLLNNGIELVGNRHKLCAVFTANVTPRSLYFGGSELNQIVEFDWLFALYFCCPLLALEIDGQPFIFFCKPEHATHFVGERAAKCADPTRLSVILVNLIAKFAHRIVFQEHKPVIEHLIVTIFLLTD
jgi:hypothetical protein